MNVRVVVVCVLLLLALLAGLVREVVALFSRPVPASGDYYLLPFPAEAKAVSRARFTERRDLVPTVGSYRQRYLPHGVSLGPWEDWLREQLKQATKDKFTLISDVWHFSSAGDGGDSVLVPRLAVRHHAVVLPLDGRCTVMMPGRARAVIPPTMLGVFPRRGRDAPPLRVVGSSFLVVLAHPFLAWDLCV